MNAKIKYQILSSLYGAILGLIIVLTLKLLSIPPPKWAALIIIMICVAFIGRLLYYLVHRPILKIEDIMLNKNNDLEVSFQFGYKHAGLLMLKLRLYPDRKIKNQLDLNILVQMLEKELNKSEHINNILKMYDNEINRNRLTYTSPFGYNRAVKFHYKG